MKKKITLLRDLALRIEPILSPDEKFAFAEAVKIMGHVDLASQDQEIDMDDTLKEQLFSIWIKNWPQGPQAPQGSS